MESSSNTSSAYASAVATPSTTPPSGSISNAGSDAENQSKLKFAPLVFPSLLGPELVADHISAPNRILLGILKRFIGVSDIASVRFSLPSQLLEPVPNLGEKDSRV